MRSSTLARGPARGRLPRDSGKDKVLQQGTTAASSRDNIILAFQQDRRAPKARISAHVCKHAAEASRKTQVLIYLEIIVNPKKSGIYPMMDAPDDNLTRSGRERALVSAGSSSCRTVGTDKTIDLPPAPEN